jgi:hypothetical protein
VVTGPESGKGNALASVIADQPPPPTLRLDRYVLTKKGLVEFENVLPHPCRQVFWSSLAAQDHGMIL